MKFEVIKQELAFSEMSQFTCRTARIGLFTVDMQMQLKECGLHVGKSRDIQRSD